MFIENRNTLITVICDEDRLDIGECPLGDADSVTGLEVSHARRAARKPLPDRLDDFVTYRDGVVADAHQLDDTAGRADRMPVVGDVIEMDEQIPGKERLRD